MGVTGANGFPCCNKESVDVIDTQIHINQHQLQLAQEEDETEPENKLVELEPPHEVDLHPDTGPELEMELDDKAVPPLESCLEPMLQPETKPDSDVEACSGDLEGQRYRIESVHPYTEEPMQQDTQQWRVRSNSGHLSEDGLEPTDHRSIRVQTSKHLFWADKYIQASEPSPQWEISRQPGKKSVDKTSGYLNQEPFPKDTLSSKTQLQKPSTQPKLLDTGSQQPPSTHSPSPSPPPAISLEDLVNFATTLAIASSSKSGLPNLGHVMKAPHNKAVAPSLAPAKKEPEQGKLSELPKEPPEKPLAAREKPREAREPEKAFQQKGENFLHPFLDFSKAQRTVIEGRVKFLQTPAVSSPPQGDEKDSVPRTKTGNPLMLKIHFKLSPPSSPEK